MKLSTPEFYVVIPARYASTRLPGKPLLDIAGKPMVVWVAERAKQSGAKAVVVATDDTRILEAIQQYGHQGVMTKPNHASGTDRIAEVALLKNWPDDAIIVNVQGDEPLIEASLIVEVATTLSANSEAVMATACHAITNKVDFLNPNVVKVVLDAKGNALYFSRAPIPYPRDAFAIELELPLNLPAYRHVGIYAYRARFLKQYATMQPSEIEQIECLEQLRVLHHGYKIAVSISHNAPAAGVDTQEDLDYVRNVMR
ncbi:MAG: 3-deoxy-manno-octulosonate cytidylyltransferase [Methylotenera sp.]|uniref:3-deoxy-manno-octulosonate cytidylyltransferase n=1 Tax=Methylotenera sp. TaxID=2051956 RepID=UPI0018363F6F|nr:3-deoxy-manno-octulosonate cytidylyltransferase [Methylotenera sp.]NOU24349.1 3-deoxy-manno-octulosonate cytidylyltransferase [Methylotenera sp.]